MTAADRELVALLAKRTKARWPAVFYFLGLLDGESEKAKEIFVALFNDRSETEIAQEFCVSRQQVSKYRARLIELSRKAAAFNEAATDPPATSAVASGE